MRASFSSYLRQHWKVLLNVVTLGALLFLIIALHKDLAETFKNLFRVHAWWLLMMLPIEFFNYDAQARLYQGLFAVVGNKLEYKSLFKTSLELNFVNSVFPSGGVSGISYFGLRMRSEEVGAGKATAVQLLKLILVYISFEILLIFGLVFMAVRGHVNDVTVLVAGSISTLLVVGTIAFGLVIGSRPRINTAFEFVTRSLNRLIQIVRPKHPETISIERFRPNVNDLHDNYRLIKDNYRRLKWPLFWAGWANLTEVLAIYVVFVAFGHWVNFGSVILAYSVANFAGLISVLPGGVGIYEALMTGVLAVAGVPASLTIPVVIMYRILNTIIQLPPGYYYYHQTLHNQRHRQHTLEA